MIDEAACSANGSRDRKTEDARPAVRAEIAAARPAARGAGIPMTGELHNAIVDFWPHALAAPGDQSRGPDPRKPQQNLPGTTWQYPNWGRKMRFTVEELRPNPEARGFTGMFRNGL